MKFKALRKKPGESFEFIDGIKGELSWVHADGKIDHIGHLMIGAYCFLFDDFGAFNYIDGKIKYNCNLINDTNLIFGNMYVTKIDKHYEDVGMTPEDLTRILNSVFVLSDEEAHIKIIELLEFMEQTEMLKDG